MASKPIPAVPRKKITKIEKNTKKSPVLDGDIIVAEQPEIPVQEEFYQIPVRFGNVPVDKAPLGWDEQRRFEKVYPKVSLPFQQIERVSFGHPELEPNKLFFGDNLHIMRMLPSKSIDLIYIDPPFFSGRNYNILYGDKNELRSFKDIWEGGMPGYLIWLNARLYEMKRLLKDTGSIYVHLDWHASHYVKVEMDKIFGYENFGNEVIWSYRTGGVSKKTFAKKHDVILFYTKTQKYNFNLQYYKSWQQKKYNFSEKYPEYFDEKEKRWYHLAIMRDVWDDINVLGTEPGNKERIGYPTQKPEALLERIIKASSNEGDVVADFFCGGGTTPIVAQKLERRWIASDISRIAVALTADRLAKSVEGDEEGSRKMQQALEVVSSSVPDFSVEHWGIYEIQKLSKMSAPQFRKFIIEAYNGRPDTTSGDIHGYKNGEPLFVGDPEPDDRISKEEVVAFAKTILTKKGIHRGTMLGWAFSPGARVVAEKLAAREGITLDFVKLNLIPIDSPEFKSHITDKHPSYCDLVSFILPPLIRFGCHRTDEKEYEFDVSESTSMNSNGKIINVQWDFNYQGRFSSTPGYSFLRGKKNESLLKVEYTFPSVGKRKIACRVQDDLGGEQTLIKEISVE
ncbi:site-specific DNA-methyltransferase [Patescibacteria group bacterium]|nr:site-specific DNA-methyltransferase [Patescibacteria group bacterium]